MYRPKTTLEQWRILQAVVDYGGYAQAADALNKSQSSLNHAVAKLQNLLDVQLLEVKGRKAFLTEAGEVMLRRSRHLSQNIQDLESLASNINQQWEPEITLAVDLAYPRAPIFEAIAAFEPESRGSRITIIDTVLTGTSEAITTGWADIVICGTPPKGYLGEPLTEVRFIPVCSPSHPLAQLNQSIDHNELMEHLQIVIKDTSASPDEKSGWLKAESRWTVSNFQSAIAMLKLNKGFCWLPCHTVRTDIESGELVQLSLTGSSHRRISMSLVHPHSTDLGPGSKRLSEYIMEHSQYAGTL